MQLVSVSTQTAMCCCYNRLQDPFGAGMRISTRYAYLGGKVCTWLQIPEPASGTIFGLYLIDSHPKGESPFKAGAGALAQHNI